VELEARDLAEESLRLTQFSIDNSTVGILWVNWDGRIQYANRAVESMLGYPTEQLLSLSLPELQPSLDDSSWLDLWNQLRSSKALSSFETTSLKADGQLLPVGVTLSFLKFGRTEYLVVYLNDITERQKARAALEESEARFKGMASNVPGMVFRLERPAAEHPVRLAFVSDASQAMLGYSPLDLVCMPEGWQDVVASEDRSSYQQAWQDAAAHNRNLAWQGRMQHQNGQLRWVDIKATVRCFDDGHVVWDGIVWDISANKHNELQLAESRGLLRSLSAHLESVREEEKARIAREVHDELGQILTVLRLETSMCELSFGQQDSKLAERLQAMKKLIEQTFQIVRDVATALRPPVLDAGIGSAIEWQARRFENAAASLPGVGAGQPHRPERCAPSACSASCKKHSPMYCATPKPARSAWADLPAGHHHLEHCRRWQGFRPASPSPAALLWPGRHPRAGAVAGRQTGYRQPAGTGLHLTIRLPVEEGRKSHDSRHHCRRP
jgi:PAS domain S-box-containing protein